ncbi:MAG: coniferyl aldehyde dehydrogenase [Polymorphobacter sp.]
MATAQTQVWDAREAQAMQDVLRRQQDSFHAELPVGAAVRRDRLNRGLKLLLENVDALVGAMSEDFGHRSKEQSEITDIMSSIKSFKHTLKHFEGWMRPETRPMDFPLWLLGARALIEYQPKGVVGIIAPWNFPVVLTFSPLANVLGAGNRAMIKPSEFTPATSELMKALIAKYFAPEEVAVITGGPEVGKAFSELAFDHMIFTGGTAVAKHVMAAAARNLVPLTLELGGKSPTIISKTADIAAATDRVALGKMMNAGQICLAPDYMMVPPESEAAVVAGLQAAVARQYPTLLANPDYTSVINGKNRDRLEGLVADARAKGANVTVVNPGNEDFSGANTNKMPLHIIQNVTDDMAVMQEEIFGPLLPIKTYDSPAEAIDYVNSHDRPLALYWFGNDAAEERAYLDRTVSGGVTVNDVIFHIAVEDLPFGGVGPSGMGSYHGLEGFRSFSHAKSIYKQPKLDLAAIAGFKPPYGIKTKKALAKELKG